jgi:hypothetical protein
VSSNARIDEEPDRLESWKEIATFLGRDERTAMRWAKQGMPVHHFPAGKRGRVYASRREISQWLARQANERHEPAAEPTERNSRRWKWPTASVGVLALLLSTVFLAFHRTAQSPPDRVTRVTFTSDSVVAWNGTRQLWEHEFRWPLAGNILGPNEPPDDFVRFVRLDESGKSVVILVAPLLLGPNPDSSYETPVDCFSNDGKLLWSYVPDEKFQFGANELQGPWRVTSLYVSYAGGRPCLWIAAAHYEWGNSFVVQLDLATGHAKLRYVNTGILYALNEVKTSKGTYLLAGGFNNEYSAGILAVINEKDLFAVSPQTPGTRHKCVSCLPGAPDEYFVFPRTEINRVEGVYEDPVRGIHVLGDQVEIRKVEAQGRASARTIYLFRTSPSIWPISLRYDSSYDMLYRRLKDERKIQHSLADSPEQLHPEPVAVWTPSGGWADCDFKTSGIASTDALPISKPPRYLLAAVPHR